MSFVERARRALARPELQEKLRTWTRIAVDESQKRRAEQGDDAELYRRRARAIRERTLMRIDEHAERFVDEATRAGAQVHFAADADEACRIVVDIARARGARLAVKMKSMVSEELHLRDALQTAGVRAVETDVGEMIIQLARETPSHLLAPAMHKSTGEVKQLFDEHLGPDRREEPEALVERARVHLRSQFVDADLGITGANFAVAESGSLLLVSNEGNGRLTLSGPPAHVALVPWEKLVPTLDEAITLLKVLVTSTGMRVTRYVSLVRGPRGAGELDGPEELHVVLVDNGRAAALGGPFEEALLCVRCGACLNACPVFQRVGGQTYGATYAGPIGIALSRVVGAPGSAADEMAHASTLCRACQDACPVRIDLPRMILESRKKTVDAGGAPAVDRLLFALWAAVVTEPRLYRIALRALAALRRWPLPWSALPVVGAWLSAREWPPIAEVPFRDRFARRRHGA